QLVGVSGEPTNHGQERCQARERGIRSDQERCSLVEWTAPLWPLRTQAAGWLERKYRPSGAVCVLWSAGGTRLRFLLLHGKSQGGPNGRRTGARGDCSGGHGSHAASQSIERTG